MEIIRKESGLAAAAAAAAAAAVEFCVLFRLLFLETNDPVSVCPLYSRNATYTGYVIASIAIGKLGKRIICPTSYSADRQTFSDRSTSIVPGHLGLFIPSSQFSEIIGPK